MNGGGLLAWIPIPLVIAVVGGKNEDLTTLLGAVGTLLLGLAAVAALMVRQKRTQERIEVNSHKLQEVDNKADTIKAQTEGWVALADRLTEQYQEIRNQQAEERARSDERYRVMEKQYQACEEGRHTLIGAVENLRGQVEGSQQ